ncbi:hypothetical protein wcw_p0012 (plasmid) [Waddlia chondrophila WSU 86-1044]|uniref:Uncharacterized protein n=1 Tax=Waddlia chondrophila (strain ATCC VR-1470 / WSU 86-1044) TaxID=716544 RepID=D6YX17_WADCW|nr:hypothetical protein wcw_p0012 [Waddlia chondrophila WSU 86-1044]
MAEKTVNSSENGVAMNKYDANLMKPQLKNWIFGNGE